MREKQRRKVTEETQRIEEQRGKPEIPSLITSELEENGLFLIKRKRETFREPELLIHDSKTAKSVEGLHVKDASQKVGEKDKEMGHGRED